MELTTNFMESAIVPYKQPARNEALYVQAVDGNPARTSLRTIYSHLSFSVGDILSLHLPHDP